MKVIYNIALFENNERIEKRFWQKISIFKNRKFNIELKPKPNTK